MATTQRASSIEEFRRRLAALNKEIADFKLRIQAFDEEAAAISEENQERHEREAQQRDSSRPPGGRA